ncbi:hypothetical protein [Alteromonas stellipolaris]|uniref:Uncharacterized protein n=1 Tax=Alteromonas stellipolaris TaxID=233316 RepID=A0ABN4LRY9_9ALTE|nr:hypothetical protein AVL57_00040 [Alteromonas stellipolaris]
MSEKQWIYDSRHIGLYQELTQEDDGEINHRDVVLCIHDEGHVNLENKSESANVQSHFSISISPLDMDNLAVAWCKTRHLSVNKYTLNELLEQSNDAIDDTEQKKLLPEREEQEELEYDNIFEVVASNTNIAKAMKERSNEFLKLREAGQALAKQAAYITEIHSQEEHITALALLEILLEDYDNNVLLFDALSASITRFEQSMP